MESITEKLYALQDEKYADFTAKLAPNVPRERFIGVRMPAMRKLAKQLRERPKRKRSFCSCPMRCRTKTFCTIFF